MSFKQVNLVKVALCASLVAGLSVLPELAIAADSGLGGMAAQATTAFDNVAKLLIAVSYVAGIGFTLAGLMGFKAHKESPQQYPLSKAIVLVAVGAALVFLPSIFKMGGDTMGLKDQGSATGVVVPGSAQ